MKSVQWDIKHVLIIFSTLAASSALAFVPSHPTSLLSAKSTARGGSTVASSAQNIDGLLLNSASLAFNKQYAISFGLNGMGNALGVSIVDTKSGPLGGGLYYIRRDLRTQAPDTLLLGNYRRLEERAGLALFSKFSERFSMGLNGKYAYQKSGETDIASGKSFNGDLSFAVNATPEFNLAFTAQNLLEDKSGLETRAFIFGAEYRALSRVSISGQIMNVSASDLAAGFELPSPDVLAWSTGVSYRVSNFDLRGGYLKSGGWNREVISAGIGYGDEKFSIDYAFQIEQNSSNQFHGVSVSGYL
jgi:hypothetical protein